jgi:frataxin-like iron-binding protein CyaY
MVSYQYLRLTHSVRDSGPSRFDYDVAGGFWVYHRDGHKLHELLQKELVQLCGGELSLDIN